MKKISLILFIFVLSSSLYAENKQRDSRKKYRVCLIDCRQNFDKCVDLNK